MSNLPPGCTQADIDRAYGYDPPCPSCWYDQHGDCADADVEFGPLCREHAEEARADELLDQARDEGR